MFQRAKERAKAAFSGPAIGLQVNPDARKSPRASPQPSSPPSTPSASSATKRPLRTSAAAVSKPMDERGRPESASNSGAAPQNVVAAPPERPLSSSTATAAAVAPPAAQSGGGAAAAAVSPPRETSSTRLVLVQRQSLIMADNDADSEDPFKDEEDEPSPSSSVEVVAAKSISPAFDDEELLPSPKRKMPSPKQTEPAVAPRKMTPVAPPTAVRRATPTRPVAPSDRKNTNAVMQAAPKIIDNIEESDGYLEVNVENLVSDLRASEEEPAGMAAELDVSMEVPEMGDTGISFDSSGGPLVLEAPAVEEMHDALEEEEEEEQEQEQQNEFDEDGSNQAPVEADESFDPSADNDVGEIFCPNCGAPPLEVDDLFCDVCGGRFGEAETPAPAPALALPVVGRGHQRGTMVQRVLVSGRGKTGIDPRQEMPRTELSVLEDVMEAEADDDWLKTELSDSSQNIARTKSDLSELESLIDRQASLDSEPAGPRPKSELSRLEDLLDSQDSTIGNASEAGAENQADDLRQVSSGLEDLIREAREVQQLREDQAEAANALVVGRVRKRWEDFCHWTSEMIQGLEVARNPQETHPQQALASFSMLVSEVEAKAESLFFGLDAVATEQVVSQDEVESRINEVKEAHQETVFFLTNRVMEIQEEERQQRLAAEQAQREEMERQERERLAILEEARLVEQERQREKKEQEARQQAEMERLERERLEALEEMKRLAEEREKREAARKQQEAERRSAPRRASEPRKPAVEPSAVVSAPSASEKESAASKSSLPAPVDSADDDGGGDEEADGVDLRLSREDQLRARMRARELARSQRASKHPILLDSEKEARIRARMAAREKSELKK